MTTVFGVPLAGILGQLMLGLVNGSFYALLSLGLAVIFGLLGVVNFAHGAFYMLGAFAAYSGLQFLGVNYWWALLLAPLGRRATRDACRAVISAALVPPRSPVRPAVDLRRRADRRRDHARSFRRIGQVVSGAASVAGRLQPRVHGASHLSRMGDSRLFGGVRHDLVPHRADSPGFDAASGDRECAAGTSIRHQRSGIW